MRLILSSLAAAWLVASPAAAEDANSFAIRDVRVFDGAKTIPDANVVVRDGRIVSVGSAAIPEGLTIIDGKGKTLLPGLIDAHVHVFPGAQADALRFGVTTELDMYHYGPEAPKWRAQRQSLTRTSEADTWTAGVGATVPGGHPTEMAPPGFNLPTVSSLKDVDPFVDARVKEGADYLKIIIEDLSQYPGVKLQPTLSREEVCALIQAAHARGLKTTVHVQAEWAAREAIECGTDGLAHLFVDRPADADVVRLAKAHHIFIESTTIVSSFRSGTGLGEILAADSRVSPYLSSVQRQSLGTTSSDMHNSFLANSLESLRRFHEAGVPLLPSTDSPVPGTGHGVALHQELQLYVLAGFTPEEALHAATELTAETFRLGDRGRIAPGYRADLILVDGDPTRRIADTLSLDRIWKNGYAVDRTPPKPQS